MLSIWKYFSNFFNRNFDHYEQFRQSFLMVHLQQFRPSVIRCPCMIFPMHNHTPFKVVIKIEGYNSFNVKKCVQNSEILRWNLLKFKALFAIVFEMLFFVHTLINDKFSHALFKFECEEMRPGFSETLPWNLLKFKALFAIVHEMPFFGQTLQTLINDKFVHALLS